VEVTVLDQVPAQWSSEDLQRRLHIRPESPQARELAGLIDEAAEIAHPKALGGIAYVEERGDDYVVVDGVRFTSRVLAVNLAETHRVFPYVATCGVELEEWAAGFDDPLQRFWSEAIRDAAMRCALQAIFAHTDAIYQPGETSRMNPGSLADWPIEEQVPLFRLLGDPEAKIGVQLTPSMLMVPSKSVSGIRFGAAGTFESCMLCPRPICPNRRAPYDPTLYEQRYRQGRTVA
jgi:hypothetical protein